MLGSGRFLPGFEDNLIGAKAAESRTFDIKFPDDYPAAAIAGKTAQFAVTVKAVDAPGSVAIDDDFAKTLGLESLAKLRDAIRERIQREHAGASRQKVKRALLDQLDERHKFSRRRISSNRNSTTFGRRSKMTSSSRVARSSMRARPRRRRAPTTGGLPSAAFGSVWLLRRSARRTTSRSPRSNCGPR